MKPVTILSLLASLVFLTGCLNTPIATKVDATIPGAEIAYKSEKDVKVVKRSYDPDTGNLIEEVEIQAVASVPAAVQAERDKVQAESNKAALELATEIIKGATPAP